VARSPKATWASESVGFADSGLEHNDEIDADIEEGKRLVEELKARSPASKLQKLLEPRKVNSPSAHRAKDTLRLGEMIK